MAQRAWGIAQAVTSLYTHSFLTGPVCTTIQYALGFILNKSLQEKKMLITNGYFEEVSISFLRQDMYTA